jgi:hypothetical protein
MIRYHLEFAGLLLICSVVTGACGSNGAGNGGGGGGPPETGDCPTSISDAHGANNAFSMFNSQLTGDYNGPDGSAKFGTVCLRLADVPQTLAITVMGAKPAIGVTYSVTGNAATGNVAIVEYAEGNNGTKVWAGISGTVQVESVARESIALSFTQVLMGPEAGKPANTATGTFTLSGSEQASDVLGFVP